MRDVKKIVLVKLEPSEPDPAAETGLPDSASSGSAAAGAVSRHTASCFQRSARRVRRSGMRDQKTVAPPGASAPAPSAVPVRFQFVVIVFVSRGFPLVPVASVSVPVFGSRAGFSGPLSGPSIGFKSVKIVQSRTFVQAPLSRLSFVQSGPPFRPPRLHLASARFRPDFRSRRPPRPRLAHARPGSASDSVSAPPPEVPVYHPVPASCSARLLFVSFMVRISKFRLVPSVQFCLIRLVCPLACPFCSVPFIFASFRFAFACFVLSSDFVFACSRTGFIYYILAYIIHLVGRKQNVFFIEKHVLFKNYVKNQCKT